MSFANFQIPQQVAYNDINTQDGVVSVSTVNLMSMGQGIYETCVWFPNGRSEVINRTRDQDQARQFHENYVKTL